MKIKTLSMYVGLIAGLLVIATTVIDLYQKTTGDHGK